MDGPPIANRVQFLSKEDVVFQSGVLDPGLLWHVGHLTLGRKIQTREWQLEYIGIFLQVHVFSRKLLSKI